MRLAVEMEVSTEESTAGTAEGYSARRALVWRGHQRSSKVIWPRTLAPMGASYEAAVLMPRASIVACHEHLVVPDEGGHQRGHQS